MLLLIGYVMAERLAELPISERNRRALLARGAHEVGAGHYPLLVGLHVAWVMAVAAWAIVAPARLNFPLAAVYLLTQGLRAWVMLTLGPYWTTRIITLPGAPLIKGGPYRFLRHPNYVVVVIELAVLPLAMGAWHIAAAFSILNAIALSVRIRAENKALAPRRLHE
jgi:methyltransferase